MQRLRSRQGAAAQAPGHCCMQDTLQQGVHVSCVIPFCCVSQGLQGGRAWCQEWQVRAVASMLCGRAPLPQGALKPISWH